MKHSKEKNRPPPPDWQQQARPLRHFFSWNLSNASSLALAVA